MRSIAILLGLALWTALGCEKEATTPAKLGALSGEWTMAFQGTGSSTDVIATLLVEHSDDSLSGTFAKPGKSPVPIQEGYARNDSVFFRFRSNLTADAPKYLYTLRGFVLKGGDELQGTWWCIRGSGRWVATRK